MQIQLQYNLYEDRLLFVASEDASRWGWWISRRAARMLAEGLMARLGEAIDPGVVGDDRDWAMAAQQEEAMARNLITDEELLAPDRLSLLVSMRHGRGDEGGHAVILVGSEGEEQGFLLSDDYLFSLMELFRRQIEQTDWGQGFLWPVPGMDGRPGDLALQ